MSVVAPAAQANDWYKRQEAAKRRLLKKAGKALKAAGVRMKVEACGCCQGAHVWLEVDGKMIVDGEDMFDIDNFDPGEIEGPFV